MRLARSVARGLAWLFDAATDMAALAVMGRGPVRVEWAGLEEDLAEEDPDAEPICTNCGDDLACEGYAWCSECMETDGWVEG